ncbi:MAG: hypothetical protein GY708_16885 [Actinomycetia bacterium]|nr:hypothetical protein [Actinomycetes bacterium]MCP4962754.1 hypothetical protein [Actinomycetes bacterium]
MSEPSAEQHRILVVGDEEYLTDLLSTLVRFQGFEVAIAGNGFDALSEAGFVRPRSDLARRGDDYITHQRVAGRGRPELRPAVAVI